MRLRIMPCIVTMVAVVSCSGCENQSSPPGDGAKPAAASRPVTARSDMASATTMPTDSQPAADRYFGFEVRNWTGRTLGDVVVVFKPHGGTHEMGGIGIGSIAAMSPFDGPVPDTADIRWTDSAGNAHAQHVQITPLPPATRTSYRGPVRQIYFVVRRDGPVAVWYHHPVFRD